MTSTQQLVLDVLEAHGPLPDHVLVPVVQHLSQGRVSSSGVRTRRNELERQGYVVEEGEVKMPSGRLAALWTVA